MIRSEDVKNAIIFCNRKRDVAILLKSLLKHSFNAGALHGDMDQSARMATLAKFRSGELTILAASDVAARGLDIPEVSHVFNFDLPWQSDDYVHRIGRTGRAGREGTAMSIVTQDDLKLFSEIEKILGEPAVWIGDAPTEEDIAEGARRKRGRGGRTDARRGTRARKPAGSSDGKEGSKRDASRKRGSEKSRRAPNRDHVPGREPQPVSDARDQVHAKDTDQAKSRRRRGRKPGENRPVHEEESRQAPEHQPENKARSKRTKPKDGGQKTEASAGGFADNVPAFLRRPPRPARAANE